MHNLLKLYVQLDKVKLCFGYTPFNVYINDITEVSTKFDFTMYADDTILTSILQKLLNISDVNLERALNEGTSKFIKLKIIV